MHSHRLEAADRPFAPGPAGRMSSHDADTDAVYSHGRNAVGEAPARELRHPR
jgi:hypothetical protein